MTSSEQMASKWLACLKKATDFDSWGQLVEAQDEYSRLIRQIKSNLTAINVTDDKKTTISKIASCLEIRIKFLEKNEIEELRLEDIKRLIPVLESLTKPSLNLQQLPSEVNDSIERLRRQHTTSSPEITHTEDNTDKPSDTGKMSSLLPKLTVAPGLSLITIHITKIGLKDAAEYIDPVITVSCIDLQGVIHGPRQTTPTPIERDDTYLTYDVDVELQVPLENMTKGTAVVFELHHYKAKKRFTSMRCYAFMDIDEIKPGSCVVELYSKPYDNRRKKLALFTKKPLYLHLELSIRKQH